MNSSGNGTNGNGTKRKGNKVKPRKPWFTAKKGASAAVAASLLGTAGLGYYQTQPAIKANSLVTRNLPTTTWGPFMSQYNKTALKNMKNLRAAGIKVNIPTKRVNLPPTHLGGIPIPLPNFMSAKYVNQPIGTYTFTTKTNIPMKIAWNPKGLPLDELLGQGWWGKPLTGVLCLVAGTAIFKAQNPVFAATICAMAAGRHASWASNARIQAIFTSVAGTWASRVYQRKLLEEWGKQMNAYRGNASLETQQAQLKAKRQEIKTINRGIAQASQNSQMATRAVQNSAARASQNAALGRNTIANQHERNRQNAARRANAALKQQAFLENRRFRLDAARLALEYQVQYKQAIKDNDEQTMKFITGVIKQLALEMGNTSVSSFLRNNSLLTNGNGMPSWALAPSTQPRR
jgi:hypothetical protein